MRASRQVLLSLLLGLAPALAAADYVPRDYRWTTPSHNSSESMPCGGHDVGMNVWVEQGDLLFYVAQSGWFDENNTLLKAGRWRLHMDGQAFDGDDFEQVLSLDEGAVYVRGGGAEVRLWVDVDEPVVFVRMMSARARRVTLSYESWRHRERALTKAECQQCSYKWVIPADCVTHADSIVPHDDTLEFFHCNKAQTVFDFTVGRERMDDVKSQLYNPLSGRLMGGTMRAPGFRYASATPVSYGGTDAQAWHYVAERLRSAVVSIDLRTLQQWEREGGSGIAAPRTLPSAAVSSRRSARWWHAFWQRSWIRTDDADPRVQTMIRNYELARYLMGCNARGRWPMKFNGGLFTFDPAFVDSSMAFTPDYRKWGGGTMTAQNQRLVYWPLLKSGDSDLMGAQLDTYLRLLPTAELWTRCHWGHGGACFTEQLENFGLPNPAEYGKHGDDDDWGVERNAWLEYEWDTCLEFCQMALLTRRYAGADIRRYEPLIESCLRFFDEHYQLLARRRGAKALDGDGHLVLYPGSGCETYKMAYNAASTVAALHTVAEEYQRYLCTTEGPHTGRDSLLSALRQRLPELPFCTIAGDTCIAPALVWARIQNVETPQLYPVFPWRMYGMGRRGLDIGRHTYLHDPHAVEVRSTKGWKQDNIWAACLGLTDEAARLNAEKLADGPYRFPAFWDPGFDWAPDLNRAGAAMTGLQEMLLQETPEGQLMLCPAWPRQWDVSFRLCATDGRTVEAEMKNGAVRMISTKKKE